MEPSSYIRQCPVHKLELQAIEPYARRSGSPPCELLCNDGPHLVGMSEDVDYWLVVHVPSGMVCYEANEDGGRLVDTRVLLVEPDDVAPRRVVPHGIPEGAIRYQNDPFLRVRSRTRSAA